VRVSRGKVLLGTFAPLKRRTNCRSNVSKSVGQGRHLLSSDRENPRGRVLVVRGWRTYSMTSVFGSLKVYHTIQASVGCPSTLAAMRIQLLLREDVSTTLDIAWVSIDLLHSCPIQGYDRRHWYLALERHHGCDLVAV